MRSFIIITIIALTGVFITYFHNQNRNQMEMQQKVMNSVYQYEPGVHLYRESKISQEYSLYK